MISFIFLSLVALTSFLVVLSVLVFFHELGHYSVARFFGVAVERFSIGFGKPIASWKAKSGTQWSIGRLPLGGYVKFLGDAGAASNPDISQLEAIKTNLETEHGEGAVESCFHFKPLWQRSLIVLAGPIANFILAIIFFFILALLFPRMDTRSVVLNVMPGSAAEAAGVQIGDRFLSLDDVDVSETSNFISHVVIRSGVEMVAKVERAGEVMTFPLTPRRQERRDGLGGMSSVGTVGINIGGRDNIVEYHYNPVTALQFAGQEFGDTLSMTGTYIGRMFQGKESGKALGGPVRIATMTGKSAVDVLTLDVGIGQRFEYLFRTLVYLAAALSIGLGVANLMPIPALDGGHLLYYGYEALAGRPLSEAKQEFGFRIGFALLLTALVILTINDIGYGRSFFS